MYWFLLLYYKMTKTGNKFKKVKRFFVFCFTECKYAAHLLNQHRQLMAEMLVALFFAKVTSIKYIRWNKATFLDFESPLYALFFCHLNTFGQTSPFPVPFTCICTLLMEPNLKKSTILFVLRYVRYKGCLKSQIWEWKVYPWLHRQVNHQLHQMHLFLQKTYFWRWNLRCTFNCNIECPLKFAFYWIVLWILLH